MPLATRIPADNLALKVSTIIKLAKMIFRSRQTKRIFSPVPPTTTTLWVKWLANKSTKPLRKSTNLTPLPVTSGRARRICKMSRILEVTLLVVAAILQAPESHLVLKMMTLWTNLILVGPDRMSNLTPLISGVDTRHFFWTWIRDRLYVFSVSLVLQEWNEQYWVFCLLYDFRTTETRLFTSMLSKL